jgi:hypothetical protein
MAIKIQAVPVSYDSQSGRITFSAGFVTSQEQGKLEKLFKDPKMQTLSIAQTRGGRSMSYEQQKLFFWMIDQYLIHWKKSVTSENRYAVYRVIQKKKFPVRDTLLLEEQEIPILPESITDLSLDELGEVIDEMIEDWYFVPAIRELERGEA